MSQSPGASNRRFVQSEALFFEKMAEMTDEEPKRLVLRKMASESSDL